MWTQVRVTAYAMAGLSGAAAIAAQLGWVDYNAATQTVTLPPISLYALAGIVSPIAMTGVAALAAVRGWGRK